MTWECDCGWHNIWWRNHCEGCGEPLPGYKEPESPKRLLDRILKDPEQPILPPALPPTTPPALYHDCGCPPYGICNQVNCPRQVRITFGGDTT